MQLVERGMLDLDDVEVAERWCPELAPVMILERVGRVERLDSVEEGGNYGEDVVKPYWYLGFHSSWGRYLLMHVLHS